MINSFTLLAEASLTVSRNLLQQLLACMNFLFPLPLFCWYKWNKLILWAIAATQTAKNQVWMKAELEQARTVQISLRSSRKSDNVIKVAWDWLKITTNFTRPISPSGKVYSFLVMGIKVLKDKYFTRDVDWENLI